MLSIESKKFSLNPVCVHIPFMAKGHASSLAFGDHSAGFQEGREGVKWELGFAFFRGWEMGFCALGLGFMKKKTIEKWEWDFNMSKSGWDCGI